MPFLTWAGNVICESASGAGIKQEVRSDDYQLHILHAVDSQATHAAIRGLFLHHRRRETGEKSDWQEDVVKQIKPCDQNCVSQREANFCTGVLLNGTLVQPDKAAAGMALFL